MDQIKYPDDFLDYIIEKIVLPYIEENGEIENQKNEQEANNNDMLQLKS